jgi:hypothetical protein
MGTREVILRPGDSLAIVLDVPGRPMRLELALTEEGLAFGAPTRRPGPAPKQDADVQSLGVMDAYVEEIIEEDEDSEEIMNGGALQEVVDDPNALVLDMDDIDEEDVAVGHDYPLESVAARAVSEVEDDSGIPSDELVMLPPTGEYAATHDAPIGATMLDLDAVGNPKERFTPSPDDTLPVWKDKASGYRDPKLDKKKKTTGAGKSGGAPAALSGFTVFLSPPRGDAKKQAAARIIADLQGIDMGSALALVGKMIVPVAKDVSEKDANNIRDRFKDAGLSCRVTQKR